MNNFSNINIKSLFINIISFLSYADNTISIHMLSFQNTDFTIKFVLCLLYISKML